MKVLQTTLFGRQKKKLHANQSEVLDEAVKAIIKNPQTGEQKKGELLSIRVYKFKIINQEYLLAYQIIDDGILLVTLGVHENFYRDLKRKK